MYRQILAFLLFSVEAFPLWVFHPNQTVRQVPGHQGGKPTRERASPAGLPAGDGGVAGAGIPLSSLFPE